MTWCSGGAENTPKSDGHGPTTLERSNGPPPGDLANAWCSRHTLLGQKSNSNPRERDRSRSGSNALLRSTASVWPPSSSKSAK